MCVCVLLWAGERLQSLFGSRSVLIQGQSLTESTPCFSDRGVSGGPSGLSRDRKSAGHTFRSDKSDLSTSDWSSYF